jgi:hypothetical protein
LQQICRNCGVPTELVEDHAAGDLICKARSLASAACTLYCFCRSLPLFVASLDAL